MKVVVFTRKKKKKRKSSSKTVELNCTVMTVRKIMYSLDQKLSKSHYYSVVWCKILEVLYVPLHCFLQFTYIIFTLAKKVTQFYTPITAVVVVSGSQKMFH